MKYSARAAPEYGAIYCKVAGSLALALTIIVYAIAYLWYQELLKAPEEKATG
jgi:hypothetical protein